MRIFITGERGFIGRNLVERIKKFENIDHVPGESINLIYHKEGEPCVYQNSINAWVDFFKDNQVDIIIHNAATVGTDVVALNSTQSTLTNIQGTYNICRAAKRLSIPVCYMGTTVIYDTPSYQDKTITELSTKAPHTLYGCQKLCAEDIVKSQSSDWMIVRPLFAYGGVGDMNSLIAKLIFAAHNRKEKVDMFLDKDKIKDYMHVYDYADAVLTAVDQEMWNDDWNVAAETPIRTGDILNIIENITSLPVKKHVKWHPKTDYLGNHRLSSEKFRNASGWEPNVHLAEGVMLSYQSILASAGYNPLKYLEFAEEAQIDLTEFY
jgi:dTDP-glucose 4,6-dehydratase